MSRTWKDRPDYVRSNDYKNENEYLIRHNCGYGVHWEPYIGFFFGYRDCNLYQKLSREDTMWHNCHREVSQRMYFYDKVDKYSRKYYSRQHRQERRNLTKRFADEYNATQSVDEDYVFTQHRSGEFGGGWFW